MTIEELLNTVIENLDLPTGQGWVTLDDLIKVGKELNGNQIGFNDTMDNKSSNNNSSGTQH